MKSFVQKYNFLPLPGIRDLLVARKQKKPKKKQERLRLGFRSLAFRYSIFFSLAIFFVFFIYFVITLAYSAVMVTNDTQKDARTLAELTISRLENALSRVEQMPVVLGRSLEKPSPDYYEILRILQGIVMEDPYIFGTCLAFEPYSYVQDSLHYGIYSYETPRGLRTKFLGGSYNYFAEDWYKVPKEIGRPTWSEPYYDLGTGDTLMCTYSVPFYNEIKGQQVFRGVLTLDVSLKSLGSIVSEIKVYETGFGFLISRRGAVIYSPDSSFINKNILDIAEEYKNTRLATIAERMMAGKSSFASFSGFRKQKSSEIYYSPLATTGWSVGIVFPNSEMYANLKDLVLYLLGAFGIILLVVFLVTIFMTRRLTRPLRKLVRITHQIGHGNFDVEIPKVKRRDEIGVLAKSFFVMLGQLQDHITKLQKTTAEKEKIESELSIAHTIQMGMLPREFPLRSEFFELFAVLDSARAVGGDLYDFFFLDKDHMFVSVGDVSGKGVPASLFMTVVRTLYRSRTMDGQPLHQIMAQINKELCKDNPNVMFVTMVSGIINLRTGTIELCNAGHNPPLIMNREGEVRRMNLFSAIPLGIEEYHGYKIEKIQLKPGDRLVLYTDGVTEALNAKGDMYHENRLSEVLHKNRTADVPTLVKKVVDSIHQFAVGVEQTDDITMLILGYQKSSEATEAPMETKKIRVPNQLEQLHFIVETVEEISRDWNISSKASMEVNLVLEELFTNIVFYAFPDKKEHLIDLTFNLSSSGILEVVIVDDGRYFDLMEASKEVKLDAALEERKVGGLGIHFVKQMMDEMSYERKGGKNVVTLKKYIK